MPLLKNMSIAAKLSAAFAMMLGLLALLALFAFTRLQVVQHESRVISGNWLPATRQAYAMKVDAADFRIGVLQSLSNLSADQAKIGANNMKAALASMKQHAEAYENLLADAQERQLMQTFMGHWTSYQGHVQRALEILKEGNSYGAQEIIDGTARQAYLALNKAGDALVEFQTRGADRSAAVSEATYGSAVAWLFGVGLAAAAMAALLALTLIRAITRPLSLAVGAADRVAGGDLSQPIAFEGRDETARLLAAMQRMQQALATTVADVRAGAESVASASAQIAQGNSDLSARTEEQASSLEETSATMEELSATVRQNADSARQANQLAQSASEVARSGGQVVGQVVDTMRGIEDSSRRIADIIATIDGIAFQTNILALNAAVEAARAGEQGRGFAVVAGEVRSLAQRSAEAAKEIKGLIHDSVERVQNGTQLVDRAGQTMQDIVSSVQRVADIVGEISSASTEQSAGIAQVGEAVTQLDKTTQQNAALVEESAAASESLKHQAGRLLASVASFRLDGRGSAVPASAPAVPVAKAPAAAPRRPVAGPGKPAAAGRPRQNPKPAAEADGEWSSF